MINIILLTLFTRINSLLVTTNQENLIKRDENSDLVILNPRGINWQKGESTLWASNCDFTGNDLTSVTNQSWDKCGNLCKANNKCTHFSWTSGGGGTCWLKQNPRVISDAFYKSGTNCGIMTYTIINPGSSGIVWRDPGSNFHWAINCDFAGSDLTNISNQQVENCGNLCSANKECTHFSWSSNYGGTCWLKNNFASKDQAVSTSSVSCGIMSYVLVNPGAPIVWRDGGSNFQWALNCDFTGNELPSISNQPLEKCGPLCSANSQCTHYTWSDYNGGTCWLKQNPVSKRDAFSAPYICGIMKNLLINPGFADASTIINWQDGSTTTQWATDCDFVGNDIVPIYNQSFDKCGPLCLANNKCTHFSWISNGGGTCYLKNNPAGTSDAFSTSAANCGVMKDLIINPGFDLTTNWQDGGENVEYGLNCDFSGNDLTNIDNQPFESCGPLCLANSKCTHFAWTVGNGAGRCWLKTNSVSISDAKYMLNANCGIMKGNSNTANLLINPGFDDNYISGCTSNCITSDPYSIYPWKIVGGSQIKVIGNSLASNAGRYSVTLNTDNNGPIGTKVYISQLVSTVPATTYKLSFALNGNPACGTNITKTGSVAAINQYQGVDYNYTYTINVGNSSSTWTYPSFNFIALSSLTTIRFTAMTVGTCGPLIDTVSLTAIQKSCS